MATKLKNVALTSVDFVENGANQDADIKLLKSNTGERGTQGADEMTLYTEVFKESIETIVCDERLTDGQKQSLLQKSTAEFQEAMKNVVTETGDKDPANEDRAAARKEGAEVKIDRNKLTKEEQKLYDDLMAKAKVEESKEKDPNMEKSEDSKTEQNTAKEDAVKPKVKEPEPEKECKTKKTDQEENKDDAVKKAMQAEMADLRKNMTAMQEAAEKKELLEIAKKYAPLGKKETDLVETLYTMKKSDGKIYDEYLSLMDQNLEMVNKSGIFSEIGKSGNGGQCIGTDAESKIDATAAELKKSDPKLSHYEALEKAWQQNPELAAEYEKQYAERRA